MHLLEVNFLISHWSKLSFSFLHRRHFVGYGILSLELINLFQLCISNLTVPVVQFFVRLILFSWRSSFCLGCFSYSLSAILPPSPRSSLYSFVMFLNTNFPFFKNVISVRVHSASWICESIFIYFWKLSSINCPKLAATSHSIFPSSGATKNSLLAFLIVSVHFAVSFQYASILTATFWLFSL